MKRREVGTKGTAPHHTLVDDDADEINNDDIYIMMKCLSVCNKK